MRKFLLICIVMLCVNASLTSEIYTDVGFISDAYGNFEGNAVGVRLGQSIDDTNWIIAGEFDCHSHYDYKALFLGAGFIYYPNTFLQLSGSPGFYSGLDEDFGRIKPIFAYTLSFGIDIGKDLAILLGVKFYNEVSSGKYLIGPYVKFRGSSAKANGGTLEPRPKHYPTPRPISIPLSESRVTEESKITSDDHNNSSILVEFIKLFNELFPVITLGGQTVKVELQGIDWIAKYQGKDIFKGTLVIEEASEGLNITLKQTHAYVYKKVLGRDVGSWIPASLINVTFEFQSNPPSIKLK